MRFAILAAGNGSRLAADGCRTPKPMTVLNGVPMIERLARQFTDCGASRIAVVVNPCQPQTVDHIHALSLSLPLDIVVAATPSPMHSLMALSPYLEGAPFVAATVDTVFRASALKSLVAHFEEGLFDGVMGVTGLADDEKPLWVRTDAGMRITGFLDERENCRFVSAGVYALPPEALDVLGLAVREGETKFRHFQRRLLDSGLSLEAFDMGQVVDVDHASDIDAARQILLGQ